MKKKTEYATPISIIEKMINNGELGEFIGKNYKDKKALGGILSAASSIIPTISNLATALKGIQGGVQVQENVNPYGYKDGGKMIDGFKQYNAPTHEQGGQLINTEGTPDVKGESEIEGTENLYKYSNIPKKDNYIFSDANGTSDLIKNIINKKRNNDANLDTPTKNQIELEIQDVENLNESINGLRGQVEEMRNGGKYNLGGVIDPITSGGQRMLDNQYENPLPNIQFNPRPVNIVDPIQTGAQRTSSAQTTNPLPAIVQAPTFTSKDTPVEKQLPGLDQILRTAGLGLNATQLFNRAEKESLVTPNYNKADERMGRMNSNLDAARDSILSGQNANSESIRSGSSSFQSQLARELQNTANSNRALTNVGLQEQQLRNQIDQTVGSYEAGKAADIANRTYQNNVDNLQNEAVTRTLRKGVLSDIVAESDRMSTIKNNKYIADASVAETQAILNNTYPDFTITDEWISKAKQLSRGEITETEYQAYIKTQSPIKYRD